MVARQAKEQRLIVTFATTTAAMEWESFCVAHAVPGRLIPVPTSISAECGMCWRAPLEARETLQGILVSLGLEGSAIYELSI